VEESGDRPTAPRGGHGPDERVHVPVLLQEAIDFLAVRRDGTYIDCTVGLGGHSFEIAKRLGAQGHLIGFDKDTHALERARKRLMPTQANEEESSGDTAERFSKDDWPRITLLHGSFAEIGERVAALSADGVLADLGVSSLQLGSADRGFSFQAEGSLDMRMDPHGELTADQVVNRFDEKTLADAIYEFGEERRSRRIARAIVRARPIRSTAHLAQVVAAAAPTMKHERIHPATRTFQGIRILVNRELDDLKVLLSKDAAQRVLKKGGRLVVISFHSLEDRIVKEELREGAREKIWQVLTKKPVTASEEEIAGNPRSRSAKLRAAEKI
jgi:16S rRNA (cytosine1402-N4)-methyltransferase